LKLSDELRLSRLACINAIAQKAAQVYHKMSEVPNVKSIALIILLQTLLAATSSAQDPRRPPPTADAPERPKGAALTFGGKTKEEILPNPYRVQAPPDRVSAAAGEVLKEIELPLDKQNSRPRAGIFITEWYEFAKGINSKSGLLRVADLPAGEIHNWSGGRYRLEIKVNLVETNVSLVTVNAVIEGLFQDVAARIKETADGTWVACQSKGVIENNILRALRDLVER
jgi:hypothetical protein